MAGLRTSTCFTCGEPVYEFARKWLHDLDSSDSQERDHEAGPTEIPCIDPRQCGDVCRGACFNRVTEKGS